MKIIEKNPIIMIIIGVIGISLSSIFVREKLVCEKEISVRELHKAAVEMVCCKAQANYAKKVFELFTDEEKQVFLRGRNAHSGHLPKNASPADYHAATAIEAVFGYLYLKGDIERLRYLFSEMTK